MGTRLAAIAAASAASIAFLTGCSGQPDSAPTITKTVVSTPQANVHGSIEVDAWQSEPYSGTITDGGSGQKVATPDGSWLFYSDKENVAGYLTGDTKAYYVANGLFTGSETATAPSSSSTSSASSSSSTGDDFVLLPIGWIYTAPAPTAALGASVTSGASHTRITLLAGGHSVPLAGNLNGGGKAVVAIPASAVAGAVIQVSYEGLVQKYDPFTGTLLTKDAAAGLYDNLSASGTGTCPPIKSGFDTGTGIQINATCGIVSVTRSAYNPAQGWATSGTVWVSVVTIVSNTTGTYRLSGVDPAVYSLTPKITAASLGGARATSSSVVGQQTTLLFAAPAGHASMALSLEVTYTGTTTDSRTASPTITVTPAMPSTSAPSPTATPTTTATDSPTAPASTSSATPSPQTFTLTPAIPGTVTIPVTVSTTIQFASLAN